MNAFLLAVSLVCYYSIFTPKPQVENEPKGYISVTCNGQLGNQMFKIASTLSYAWDNDLTPVFPSLNASGDNLQYNRDHYFVRLKTDDPNPALKKYELPVLNYCELPKNLNNVLLEGGFFSWKYFDHHRAKLLEIFSPTETLLSKLNEKYADLLAKENTVAIHVRTYSQKTHATGLHFVGLKYFEEAMQCFPADSTFVVFTDREGWTRHHFEQRFPGMKFVFIGRNDHLEDFVLMSKMKHQIISNSTYSWWAAYLNENPSKIVCHPKLKPTWLSVAKSWVKPIVNVFRPNAPLVFKDEEYYKPEWTAIEYEVESYPADIYTFGDQTKSVFPHDK